MDLYRLHDTAYTPQYLIEGYDSLIWTERFQDPGEFKLESYDVEATMGILPLDCVVGIRESWEAMIVENHEIVEDDKGVDKLVVSGRSFEIVMENRVTALDIGSGVKIVDATRQEGTDPPVHEAAQIASYSIEGGFSGTADIIPNVNIWHTIPMTGTIEEYSIPPGPLYDAFMTIVRANDCGVETIRPFGFVTDLGIHIYKGVDRRADVVFSTRAGHFDSGRYFFSTKGEKNTAYVFNDTRSRYVNLGGVTRTSRARKDLYVDATDIKEIKAGSGITMAGAQKQRGQAELAKNKAVRMYEGKVSKFNPYIYKTHYNLGDLVTIRAKYGIVQDVYVTEYIRTQTKEGDSGYPTLSMDLGSGAVGA